MATGDAAYTTDIGDNVGIALFNTATPGNFNLTNRLDAVGSSTEVNIIYRKALGYPAVTTGTLDYSFFRNLRSGLPQDTGNNFASGAAEPPSATPQNDFVFADPTGTLTAAGARLGAPGQKTSLVRFSETQRSRRHWSHPVCQMLLRQIGCELAAAIRARSSYGASLRITQVHQ